MVLLFKLMIQNYNQIAMLFAHDCNPITQLCERLGTIVIMNHCLFKWFKMENLCIIMVLVLTWRAGVIFPTFLL